MFSGNLMYGGKSPSAPKEGELYKEVTVGDKTFKLYYGYYEDFERESLFNEPIPIYPDFIKQPQHTAEGFPLVTAMQNVCKHYSGKSDEDSSCSACIFFEKQEDLFGICNCIKNKVKISEYKETAENKNE